MLHLGAEKAKYSFLSVSCYDIQECLEQYIYYYINWAFKRIKLTTGSRFINFNLLILRIITVLITVHIYLKNFTFRNVYNSCISSASATAKNTTFYIILRDVSFQTKITIIH